MPIIKHQDIIKKGDPLLELKKSLKQTDDLVVLLTKSNKKLSESLQSVKKSSDGTEAKKLIETTNKLTKSTLKLKEVKLASQRVNELILKNNAKLVESATKEAVALEKVKIQKQQNIKAAKELAREELKLVKAHERLTKQTNEAQLKFKNLATQFGVNSKQAKKAKLEFQKLDNKLRGVNNAARDGRRDVGRYGTALKGVGSQLVGALGLTAGVTALVGVIRNAGKIFITFEKSASKLAAILGKSKDEIKDLTEQAKRLGSTTAFTASEVISLQTELAKLGFSVKQIEASTAGILDLAAATGQDLAESAELAGATLRIFNLDAIEMNRVTDVLAKSTTVSSLSMTKLATILPIVGKTAQIAGVSLERTAALAGTLTDRGLDASSAATSLRNIFLELSKKGLTWEEAMAKINASTDKNKTSMDLFGKRAAAAGVILSETAANTDKLTTSLENSTGAAKMMADVMLDNLAGDITKSQSAWEGFILSLEEGNGTISRVLRGAVQWFTGLLERLRLVNEGSARISQFEKDRLGITKFINNEIDKQNKKLQEIANTDERSLEAQKKRQKLIALRNQAELDALTAKEEGDDKALIKSTLLIDAYSELIDNVEKYIPELKTQNEETSTTAGNINDIIEGTDIATASTKKYIIELDNLNRGLEQQLKTRQQIAREALGGVSGVDTLQQRTPTAVTEIESQGLDFDPIAAGTDITKQLIKENAKLQEEANAEELKRLKEQEEAKKLIKETFLTETTQFAADVLKQNQDEKLAAEKSAIEAEKKIQEDNLEKGLINEIQFNTKIRELNNRERQAEARAEKKKALFDVAIATYIAVAKAGFITPAAIAIGIAGAIRAAFIAARPIPKFEKGGKVGGKLHRDGGTIIEAQKDEFVVSREGYSNAPLTTEAINKGLIRDIDLLGGMKKDYNFNNISKKLDDLNQTNKDMLELSKGNVSTWELGGFRYVRFGNGEAFKEIKNG